MASELVIGIDVGTGSTKGVLVDACGSAFSSASYNYRYKSPGGGGAEQPPEDWWQAVCSVTRKLLAENPGAASQLKAIGISGQGVAAVTLDAEGRPVRDAMLWMDTRCSSEAEKLDAECGEWIAPLSGKRPAAYNLEPKLIWLREKEPEAWQRVAKFTTTTGYINYRLTGKLIMNHSDAGVLLSYDLRRRDWSAKLMAAMGLSPSLYADLAECDSVIGFVTESAARDSALPPGLPVVAGGEDTSSAGLAMGVFSETDVQLSMGNACTMYIPFREPVTNPHLLAFPHVVRGYTLLGGSMVSGGISIEWITRLLGLSSDDASSKFPSLEEPLSEAELLPPCGDGLIFLPYLAGELQPLNDGYARGVLFGLSLDTTPAAVARAVMEGTAFAIRHNIETAVACGAQPQRIFAVGGPSKNDLWCQIITDTTGLPLHAMSDSSGAALGSAILAAVGGGAVRDFGAMQKAHGDLRRSFAPNSAHASRLHHGYCLYRELYPRLRDLFPKLSSLRAG